MALLHYSMIASLDGFIEDTKGDFKWAMPDEEVLKFINDQERPVGTLLYGRRMYETMLYWEAASLDETEPMVVRDWTRMWRAADKVVYSRTLKSASSAKTRIERTFEPESVRRLKETSSRDLSVGGPELAGHLIDAGLVDEAQLYVVPAIVGGGKPWLPKNVRSNLELLDTRRFSSGFVFLRYRLGKV
jgi:dihydrofolate reductase